RRGGARGGAGGRVGGCERVYARRSQSVNLHVSAGSGGLVATGQVDTVSGAGTRVGGEVTPPAGEGWAEPPGIGDGVVDVHLVAGVGGYAATAQHPHLAIYVHAPRLTGGPRDLANGDDRVSARVKLVRVLAIEEVTAGVKRIATRHVDQVANSDSG